jgi:DNA-binding transcriptional LysR family regulator
MVSHEALAKDRRIVFRVSDISGQVALARSGVGIALLPEFIAQSDPTLNKLADDGFALEVWMSFHKDLRKSHPIKTVREFIKSEAVRFSR